MKRKFKIMNHQIEQLKEEITAKDQALVKEHFDHKKVRHSLQDLHSGPSGLQLRWRRQPWGATVWAR